MEQSKELKQKFLKWVVGNMEYGYLYEDITDDGDGIFQLTDEGEAVVDFIEQELDKAREEGYQNCMDDIWEKARGLRSWTEHDGSISATDIEAGLQEAYLEIESKLKDNK